MADPMWPGGANQFQDEFPWAWALMNEFNRTPFYPTDPPRDPGAFYDSVAPLIDYPIIGFAFAWVVPQYAEYYAQQWLANPPATSTSTANPITQDADTSMGAKMDSILTYVETINRKLGSYPEPQTVLADLAAIWGQVSGGLETPPPVATIRDTNIILAALYYIANQVVVPAWSLDNSEVLAAITADGNDTRGDLTTHDTLVNGKLDSLGGSLVTVDSIVDDLHVDLSAVHVDVDGIIETLANGLEATPSGPGGYPGSSGVTQSIPRSFSGPLQHDEAMDGVIVHLTTIPAGTGRQTVNGHNSWQHMGWLAFLADDGTADELQWLNLENAVYVPKRIAEPAGLLLFPRSGAEGTLVPWVRLP